MNDEMYFEVDWRDICLKARKKHTKSSIRLLLIRTRYLRSTSLHCRTRECKRPPSRRIRIRHSFVYFHYKYYL